MKNRDCQTCCLEFRSLDYMDHIPWTLWWYWYWQRCLCSSADVDVFGMTLHQLKGLVNKLPALRPFKGRCASLISTRPATAMASVRRELRTYAVHADDFKWKDLYILFVAYSQSNQKIAEGLISVGKPRRSDRSGTAAWPGLGGFCGGLY